MPENRLADEISPYLLQHKNNPVDWYPWCEEAFEKAEKENKPVFLSIGYSTCHWCHVMEHESFEDPEVAEYLNEHYISIKVDREERPDIDHIYMTVCQMITGSGGWPLTIIMTPDKKPFFAGTYFPKTSRTNRIGLMELTEKLVEVWTTKQEIAKNSADEISEYVKMEEFKKGNNIDDKDIKNVFDHFVKTFDKESGGFGTAPKFPAPHNLMFLMRYYKSTGEEDALNIVEKTLCSMRQGGIFDQVGYGFHRYSTDSKWLVPHFEKMLYDQALLLMAFTEAYQLTGKEKYMQTSLEITEYIFRDMTSDEGGFFSAEDADSESVEGKFYLWELQEIKDLLSTDKAELINEYFNISGNGNFKNEMTQKFDGKNIPHLKKDIPELAKEKQVSVEHLAREIHNTVDILFDYRCRRIRPHLDDKILTDWNGLMIAALAKAGRAFNNFLLVESAVKAVQFILDNLYDPETNTLYHRYREGLGGIESSLDDFAFLIRGLLELYQADFDNTFLLTAIKLNEKLEIDFLDKENGGYFFSSANNKDLIVRKKILYDGAVPSGNSVMYHNLLDLYLVTGEAKYIIAAENLAKSFAGTIEKNPFLYSHFISAAIDRKNSGKLLIITGTIEDKSIKEIVNRLYQPDLFILNINEKNKSISEKIPYLKNYPVDENSVKYYVCRNGNCSMPTENIYDALKILE